jgi:hypothetical protein
MFHRNCVLIKKVIANVKEGKWWQVCALCSEVRDLSWHQTQARFFARYTCMHWCGSGVPHCRIATYACHDRMKNYHRIHKVEGTYVK